MVDRLLAPGGGVSFQGLLHAPRPSPVCPGPAPWLTPFCYGSSSSPSGSCFHLCPSLACTSSCRSGVPAVFPEWGSSVLHPWVCGPWFRSSIGERISVRNLTKVSVQLGFEESDGTGSWGGCSVTHNSARDATFDFTLAYGKRPSYLFLPGMSLNC